MRRYSHVDPRDPISLEANLEEGRERARSSATDCPADDPASIAQNLLDFPQCHSQSDRGLLAWCDHEVIDKELEIIEIDKIRKQYFRDRAREKKQKNNKINGST